MFCIGDSFFLSELTLFKEKVIFFAGCNIFLFVVNYFLIEVDCLMAGIDFFSHLQKIIIVTPLISVKVHLQSL
jgi:hypothetical protein